MEIANCSIEVDEAEDNFRELKKILVQLNMDNLFSAFEAAGINDDIITGLNVNDKTEFDLVGSLIPNIGTQIKFRRAIQNLQRALEGVSENDAQLPGCSSGGREEDIESQKKYTYTHFNHKTNLEDVLKQFNVYKKLVIETNGILNDKLRKSLVKIIVEYTVQERIWISQRDFPIIFEKIKAIFPSECMDIYFTPKSASSPNPTGILWSSYRYNHGLLKKESKITKNLKRKVNEENVGDAVENSQNCSEESEQIRRDLLVRFEPWRRVLSDWRKTVRERRSELFNPGNLTRFFSRWPKYKMSLGKELVDVDFKFLYPDKSDNLYKEYTSCSQEVMKAAALKTTEHKEKAAFAIDFDISSDDIWYGITFLKALLYLLPYGNKKKQLNPSIRIGILVQFIELGDDLMQSVLQKAEKQEKLHPYMLVGNKNGLPSKYYVCAYDCIYCFDNFVDCLDKLFKVFFVFNIAYPKELNAVYLFIQQFIYRIYLHKKDKNESATNGLINVLDKSRLPSQNNEA